MGDPGTGTVPDLAAGLVDVAAAETVITAEAEVGVGGSWLYAPFPVPSDFRRPSSRGAGLSTHAGMGVYHSPLSALFWSPQNSSKAPDYTLSIAVVLQE